MNNKTIRWQQRFENLQKAFSQLSNNLNISSPNDAEKQGIIKSFEYTFELSWKTLKDYLESEGIATNSPRQVIKQAFHNQIITDGDTWIDMLDQRNLMAHTYDEARANQALDLIRNKYFSAIQILISYLTANHE
jgi:nucleotidyltransferase substrate binding protein (TIGR01987 family)